MISTFALAFSSISFSFGVKSRNSWTFTAFELVLLASSFSTWTSYSVKDSVIGSVGSVVWDEVETRNKPKTINNTCHSWNFMLNKSKKPLVACPGEQMQSMNDEIVGLRQFLAWEQAKSSDWMKYNAWNKFPVLQCKTVHQTKTVEDYNWEYA